LLRLPAADCSHQAGVGATRASAREKRKWSSGRAHRDTRPHCGIAERVRRGCTPRDAELVPVHRLSALRALSTSPEAAPRANRVKHRSMRPGPTRAWGKGGGGVRHQGLEEIIRRVNRLSSAVYDAGKLNQDSAAQAVKIDGKSVPGRAVDGQHFVSITPRSTGRSGE